jgi:type IV pilus assembly protein PilQ
MYKKLVTYHSVIFSTLCALLLFQAKAFCADSSAPKSVSPSYLIQDILTDITTDSITIRINGNTAPAYTTHEQFEPFRLVMDIAGVEFAKKVNVDKPIPDNKFIKLSTTNLTGKNTAITRFAFQIKEGYQYKVDRENTDIIVKVFPAPPGMASAKEVKSVGSSSPDKTMGKNQQGSHDKKTTTSDSTLDELIGSSVAALEQKQKKNTDTSHALERAESLEDPFANAGYTKQRISVDFYKIDIHNVFRLFRQVSNMNIIVDEAVKGSVTIALHDVPWDFALDIICNLDGLKKEERFNTIVIYPKSKSIEWPISPLESLSIKTDKRMIQQEALIVQQSLNQPKEITQAKKFIAKAQQKEKDQDLEEAAGLYEQAFALWPKNDHLSDKLAALNLINLRINAKALYYAKKSLQIKRTNDNAALMAAIASANMHHIAEASEYFNQSVSGSPPLKEALLSYAAFNENFDHPDAALKLLNKYSELYGETLDTMVSKARIYDKKGNSKRALEQYRSILLSGFQISPDLKRYIEGRLQAGKF